MDSPFGRPRSRPTPAVERSGSTRHHLQDRRPFVRPAARDRIELEADQREVGRRASAEARGPRAHALGVGPMSFDAYRWDLAKFIDDYLPLNEKGEEWTLSPYQ